MLSGKTIQELVNENSLNVGFYITNLNGLS